MTVSLTVPLTIAIKAPFLPFAALLVNMVLNHHLKDRSHPEIDFRQYFRDKVSIVGHVQAVSKMYIHSGGLHIVLASVCRLIETIHL